jgi:hypothetical protein
MSIRGGVARGTEYRVTWKGSDVVDISSHGEPVRLYQRKLGVPKDIPAPPPRREGPPEGFDARPTEQKK